jgi:hypothetical protein
MAPRTIVAPTNGSAVLATANAMANRTAWWCATSTPNSAAAKNANHSGQVRRGVSINVATVSPAEGQNAVAPMSGDWYEIDTHAPSA